MLEVVAGRYRLEEEIGKGGMGTVFRGVDSQSGETIAIKRLKPEINDSHLIERFKREGEALRTLNHPNIVKMLDALEENGRHYLILEYFSAGDLNSLLKQGQLSVERILQIALDLSDALTRAHRLNIVHRDIKPANILLDAQGKPHLSDFGIAYIANKERVTAANQIVGTLDYVAPEILRNNEVEPRSDIWAFGMILFEMLTGKHPFRGANIAQTVNRILGETLPDIQALNPETPTALADLVYRMLERDPKARIPSVRYVGAELESILAGHQEKQFDTPISDVFLRERNNLPKPTTHFVGRENEIAEIGRLLRETDTRLVTILAQGGMGKTRLALQIGESLLENFANGVYFTSLAPLNDSSKIVPAIAESIGYSFQNDSRSSKQQLLDYLQNKQMLLILDNYEHLIDAANLSSEILSFAPEVKILATSRQRLNQSGETLFPLQGMSFPVSETLTKPESYTAIQLFLQAARRIQPEMELLPEEYAHIGKICKLVEGLPLGIVLAASWVSLLSLEEIAIEIEKGIDFLASEIQDMPERHQSIRAVMDYSWRLLAESEQDSYMKLTLFRGGFSREAAEAVAGANLRTLMNLMNKSLLRRDASTGRYGMHNLLRQYGEDALNQQGEYETVAKIHAEYYLNILAALWQEDSFTTPEAVEKISQDDDNLQAALNYAAAHGLDDSLRTAVDALSHYYDLRGQHQEGVLQFQKLRDSVQTRNPKLANWIEVYSLNLLMSYDVAEAEPRIMKLSESLNADSEASYKVKVYSTLATLKWMIGQREEHLRYTGKMLTAATQADLPALQAWAQSRHAFALNGLGRFEEAKPFAVDAIIFFSAYRTHLHLCEVMQMAGHLALADGHDDAALQHFGRALEESKRWKSLFPISMSIYAMMTIYIGRGEDDKVRELLREGLLWHKLIGQDWQTLGLLMGMSREFYDYLGGLGRAVEIMAMVLNHPESSQYTKQEVGQALERIQAKLSAEVYQAAYERGKVQPLDTVVKALLSELLEKEKV